MSPSLALPLLLAAAAAPAPEAAPPEPESLFADTVEPSETVSLDDAVARLATQNPDLESAAAAIDDAHALVLQSLAAVKPILAVSGNYTRNNDEATIDLGQALGGISDALARATGMPVDLGAPTGETIIQPLQSLTASAQLEVPLFAANAYWDIKAARQAVKAREADREALHAQLRGALTSAACLSGAAAAMVEVSRRALANSEAHLQTARNRFDAGQGTRLSVDQAELQVLRRRRSVVQAAAALERAELMLGGLLGKPHPVRIRLPQVAVRLSPLGDLDAAVREAIGRRPEIDANHAERVAARHQLLAAKMRHAPTLSASLGASTSTVPLPTGLSYGWQAGLTLRWTLYAGGARRAARRRAEANLRRLEAERRQLVIDVSQDVRNAARDLVLARHRFAEAKQEVAVAERAAKSAQRTFAEGRASSLEVIDALDESFQAQLRLEESHARVAAATADLRTAQGTI